MAKLVVKAGLCKRACVQLSYAIGVAKPLFVETYGTEKEGLTAKLITNIVKINFDARPGALARDLSLHESKYNKTAAPTAISDVNHLSRMAWSSSLRKKSLILKNYAGMSGAQVEQEVAAKQEKILTKWVD